ATELLDLHLRGTNRKVLDRGMGVLVVDRHHLEKEAMGETVPLPWIEPLVDHDDRRPRPRYPGHLREPRRWITVPIDGPDMKHPIEESVVERETMRVDGQIAGLAIVDEAEAPFEPAQHPHTQIDAPDLCRDAVDELLPDQRDVAARSNADLEHPD